MKILIVDNYDSFTYNLYQCVGQLLYEKTKDFDILVKRNDELTLAEADKYSPDRIIISPGPGHPKDKKYFGICEQIIISMGNKIPLLGVCLGMQGIAQSFGGKIVNANKPMHGKTSLVVHDGKGIFFNIPQNIETMRYHSLMVDYNNLPSCFEISALLNNLSTANSLNQIDKENYFLMAIRHKIYPIEGIQFHPESFATEGGMAILRNFIFSK